MIEKKRVIALGFFDGLHIGHSALMRKTLDIGQDQNLIPSVITFDMHPLSIVRGVDVPLINSPEDRAGLIHRVFGIDDIIFLHFDKTTSHMQWSEFIDHLVAEFGARRLVAGHDFRFGFGGMGNSELLERKCGDLGIGCDIIPEVKLNGVTSSSTYIRELISTGDLERANAFLGHPHVLTDVVRYGYRLGRTLGTPTINMCFQDGVLVPAFGVYATKVFLDNGGEHIGVTNIGVRPTVDSSGEITAETHILNFQGNLYGRQVRIEFYTRLRPEIKFDDTSELKTRIHLDCEASARFFTNEKWQWMQQERRP
ncbi:MAG: riboflavin biosynthesis protein RibF [Oscillospiraceae bacterium]|nr:riboflavin biosynthesis protein RibF [Oscillospiraceae bacterium]